LCTNKIDCPELRTQVPRFETREGSGQNYIPCVPIAITVKNHPKTDG
jgi:hypothetical protein